jgi:hypothetical protein
MALRATEGDENGGPATLAMRGMEEVVTALEQLSP